ALPRALAGPGCLDTSPDDADSSDLSPRFAPRPEKARFATMPLYERIVSSVIGTPLQRPAEHLRRLWQLPRRLRYPELREIYLEQERIYSLIGRTITPAMNCIDVGCHLGSFLYNIIRLSPYGKHIAVEPIPYKADWLRRRFPAVEVHQIVLG